MRNRDSVLKRKSVKLTSFLALWRAAWFVGMPFILLYLWNRGRKDSDYSKAIGQRFGFHAPTGTQHIWVHAVSLGELRSAVPIIREFLGRGEHIVTTHFTPAGRREAEKIFAREIADGRLKATWVPFDYGAPFKRFFKAFQPKFGLVMEVEFWPGMIFAARKARVPLFLCNGQYPGPSFERDKTRVISPADFVNGFSGVLVKSEEQADRFRALGVPKIAVTGEMRFDQPVPEQQTTAAGKVIDQMPARDIIGLCIMTADEEGLVLATVSDLIAEARSKGQTPPLFVVVPRAPERFGPLAGAIGDLKVSVIKRSDAFSPDLTLNPGFDLNETDVLFGDSLGEMYFYQSLCDRIVIGGGFTPAGSHNIIEPISLGKPVYVGPTIWTIEFPAREAIAAGVCVSVDANDLAQVIRKPHPANDQSIEDFFAAYGGSVAKSLAALKEWGAY